MRVLFISYDGNTEKTTGIPLEASACVNTKRRKPVRGEGAEPTSQ